MMVMRETAGMTAVGAFPKAAIPVGDRDDGRET